MDTAASDYRTQEYKHIATEDKQTMSEVEDEMSALKDKFESALNNYDQSSVLPEEKQLVAEIKTNYSKYMEMSNQILQLSRDLKTQEAMTILYAESKERFDGVNNNVAQLVMLNQEQASAANSINKATYNEARLILIGIVAIIVIVSIFVAIYMINGITKPMKLITGSLEKTAKFNLVDDENNARILRKYKDEFGVMGIALLDMRKSLREIVKNIRENSSKVLTNSSNLSEVTKETSESMDGVAKAIDEMAQGSTELAKNAQTGSEKLQVLADEINEAVDSSNLMKNHISEASKVNSEGMNYTKKLKEVVQTNAKGVEEVTKQVDVLDNKSEAVGKITDVIKSIAAQINLLSLNAAIEAARAGEQGKGFAVVADEIRKLATETSESTKEIDNIISEIKKEINTTKSKMADNGQLMTQTIEVSKGTEKAFEAIDNSVANIVRQIESLGNSINNMDKKKMKLLVI
jgi:methyl-accepting chemotaxis protein